METGDVVIFSHSPVNVELEEPDKESLDPKKLAGVTRSQNPYSKAIGVISTRPGVVLSENLKNGMPVTLAGRTPTKISLENGPVMIGDHLVAASKPGHAMKATGPGYVVGIALEPFDGKAGKTGKIMTFIQPGWWDGGEVGKLIETVNRLNDENEQMKLRLDKLEKRLAEK